MPDAYAWESIARHARQHGRSAVRFDATDLFWEGFRTAPVSVYVLADVDEGGVVRYWSGRYVLDASLDEGASLDDGQAVPVMSSDPGGAELFVSYQEASDEASLARLASGWEFCVCVVVR